MNLHEWLDEESGRAKWLAEKLGAKPAAVSLWRDNGVPITYMVQIADLTACAVTVVDMVVHASHRRAENKKAREAA